MSIKLLYFSIFIFLVLFLCSIHGDGLAEPASQWLYQSESKWNKEWSSGEWDYLDLVPIERSRIVIIGGVFIRSYSKSMNATILDVGCGEGAISDYLLPSQKSHYVGLDISKDAIMLAKRKRGSPMKFVHSAAHQFQPMHKFDVIIFSEVLYYVEYEKVLDQYVSYLNPNGIVIISIFKDTKGKQLYENIFAYAKKIMNMIDYTDLQGWTRKKQDGDKIRTGIHIEVYRKK